MRNLIKFSCLLFSMALLSSCSNSEEPDYPAVASSISNSILIDILDSEGNSLIDNEAIMNGLSWRSLKVPWNPILAKDSTYPIQEEWNISNAM